jgi:predicted kinase
MMKNPRTIIFIAGYAGVGKTMTGKIIASKLHASYIDKDTLYKLLVRESLQLTTGNPNDRTSDFYCDHFKINEYKGLIDVALENVKLNPVSVVVGPFTNSRGSITFEDTKWTAEFNRRCQKIGAKWHVIWVYSTNDTIKRQLIARKSPRDEWKLTHWEEYIRDYPGTIPDLPIKNYTVLKNDGRNLHELEQEIDAILNTLDLTPERD